MKETWKPVVGWVGLYEVSDQGRVRSLDRVDRRGYRLKGRVLSPGKGSGGYFRVNLCRNGYIESATVHRLVAEAFISLRPKGQDVRHGPGGRQDNRASNLCYGTRSDNEKDKIRDGTDNRGEKHCQAKLTESDVLEILTCLKAGAWQRDIAERFGVSQGTISGINTGKTWKHLTKRAAI